MDNNELRDAIEGTLEHTCCEDFETQADSILSLLAPILADAEKWKLVSALANSKSCVGCKYVMKDECVLESCCFDEVVNALEGEGEKG